MFNVKDIEQAAKKEFEDELFREAVNKRKERLWAYNNLPWYKKLFPYRIKIERII